MKQKQQKNIHFYQFSKLSAFSEIDHGVFTRNNGYSKPPFHSLNTSISVGDRLVHVQKNREAIASCMGGYEMIFMRQEHGKKIVIYTGNGKSNDPKMGNRLRSGDAMMTQIKNKLLVIQVADCQAVLLYDPVVNVIANIHSGWRGSIRNIVGRTVNTMAERFHSDPLNIIAGIGPSLGPCCAEFIHYKKEIPKAYWKYKVEHNHFDFWSVSRDQLIKAGVLKRNIDESKLCTKCHTDEFFSYRGEGQTGRFASVIGLR